MKPWAMWLYKSKAWRECRRGFLQSKHFICERCEGAASIAHHKVYLTPENINDQEITLNWDLLEALCLDCHTTEHLGSKEEVTRDDVMFNALGELVRVGE